MVYDVDICGRVLDIAEDQNHEDINRDGDHAALDADFYLSPTHRQWTKLESISQRFIELVKHCIGDHCSKQK